jgi:hypothetical protein
MTLELEKMRTNPLPEVGKHGRAGSLDDGNGIDALGTYLRVLCSQPFPGYSVRPFAGKRGQ